VSQQLFAPAREEKRAHTPLRGSFLVLFGEWRLKKRGAREVNASGVF